MQLKVSNYVYSEPALFGHSTNVYIQLNIYTTLFIIRQW